MKQKIFYTMKKLLFFLLITGIVFLCVLSVRLMYQADDKYTVQIPASSVQVSQYSMDDIYTVEKSDLPVNMQISGIIAPSDDAAMKDISIDTNVNGIELLVTQGQILQPEEPYAEVWGKPHTVKSPMRCHSITWREDGCTLRFLDYSTLYAEAMIPQTYLKYDLNSLDYTATAEDVSFPVRMSFSDSFVSEGYVSAQFELSELRTDLLPGTELVIETTLETKKDVPVVPLSFIIVADHQYFVQTTDDLMTLQSTAVEIGEIYENMAEIKSGLNEGTMLVLPSSALTLASQTEK